MAPLTAQFSASVACRDQVVRKTWVGSAPASAWRTLPASRRSAATGSTPSGAPSGWRARPWTVQPPACSRCSARLRPVMPVTPTISAVRTMLFLLSRPRPRRGPRVSCSLGGHPGRAVTGGGRSGTRSTSASARSAGRSQPSLVASPAADVDGGPGPDPLGLLGPDLAHDLAGHAHDHRVVRDLLALADERLGGDQAVAADPGAVQDHRPDPDQRARPDRAAVQHGEVADRDVGADGEREAGVGMEDAVVLHVAPLPDRDRLVVAAQDRTPPDRGVALEPDLADQHG